jgi:hypothetical protein
MADLGLEISDGLAVVASVGGVSLDAAAVQDLVALEQQQQMDLSAAQQLGDLTALQSGGLDLSHAQIFGNVADLTAVAGVVGGGAGGVGGDVVVGGTDLTTGGNAAEEDIFADFDLGDLGDDFNFDA